MVEFSAPAKQTQSEALPPPLCKIVVSVKPVNDLASKKTEPQNLCMVAKK